MKAVTCLAVALAVICCLRSGAGDHVDKFSWTAERPSGREFFIQAAAIDSGPRLYFESLDKDLYREGLVGSKAILDYSTDPAVAAIRLNGQACYIVEFDGDDPVRSYDTLVMNLTSFDAIGTQSEDFGTLYIDASGNTKLGTHEIRSLFSTNRNLAKVCTRAKFGHHKSYLPIFRATETSEEDFPTGKKCTQEKSTFIGVTLRLLIPKSCRSRSSRRSSRRRRFRRHHFG